ncbi:unnamed protein product, partial [Prorocentrum cordatum]
LLFLPLPFCSCFAPSCSCGPRPRPLPPARGRGPADPRPRRGAAGDLGRRGRRAVGAAPDPEAPPRAPGGVPRGDGELPEGRVPVAAAGPAVHGCPAGPSS